MFLHNTPKALKKLYPSLLWQVPTVEKEIYLTFDDGPIPELTPWVLDTLKSFEVKATFFCVGENLQLHRTIAERIVAEGHCMGNHTHNHLNGWKTPLADYMENVSKADKELQQLTKTDLFRPPYGRISRNQIKALGHKRIIMWDVLSGDYSIKLSPQTVLEKSIEYTSPGSIVLFHDNEKATERLKYALPNYIEHFQEQGYSFKTL